jgi:uncharacterized protein
MTSTRDSEQGDAQRRAVRAGDEIAAIAAALALTPARCAYLFGSQARGDADEYSDVDIVVIADTPRPFVERFQDYLALWEAVSAPLELIVYTPEEWEKMRQEGNPFVAGIFAEGRIIYARSGA